MNLDRAESLLRQLLAPAPLDPFLDETFGTRFAKFEGSPDNWRAGLLGPDPKAVILNAAPRFAHRIIFHAEAPLGPPPTIEPLRDAAAFKAKIDAFHSLGYTVRLPEVRSLTPQLAELVRAIEFFFQRPAAPDLYWSRGGARAPVHHDDYDLLAIQIKGRKQWFINTEAPTLMNTWREIPRGPEKLDPHTEIVMEPGDLLYMPKGVTHTVESFSDSIHVSIGFTSLTLREAMNACVDFLSDEDRSLRETINPRIARDLERGEFGNLPARLRGGFSKLMAHCQSEDFIDEAMQRRSSRVISGFSALPMVRPPDPLTLDTRLRHKLDAAAHISGNGTTLDFAYPGGHHYIHRGAEEAVRFIAATPEFRPRDLPGKIGDDIRLALAQKLVESGFLTTD